MALDRSKFKPTKISANKEKDQAVDSAMGRQGRGERADLHKIVPGKNYFRIYPPHPTDDENATYAEPVVRVFLPAIVEDKDEKGEVKMEKGKPVMKRISKPIFNSRIHGDTPKDLVEEYVNLGKRMAEDMSGKTKDLFLVKLLGRFSKNKDERLPGLLYKTNYAMYADKIEDGKMVKFARLEVGIAVKDGMNKASAVEGSDEVISVDPWTDPEDGRAVVIDYNDKASKPADYYNVQIDNLTTKNANKQLVVRTFPLSDEQLENYLKYPSLASLYKKAFKRRDFELQLAGLELFDAEYELGIFASSEFDEIVQEINEYYSFDDEKTEEVKQPITSQNAGVEEVEEEEVVAEEEEAADELDLMSRVELRNTNTTEQLGIRILTTMSDDTLREAIRQARKNGPAEKTTVEPEPVKTTATAGTSAADRLRKLRGEK